MPRLTLVIVLLTGCNITLGPDQGEPDPKGSPDAGTKTETGTETGTETTEPKLSLVSADCRLLDVQADSQVFSWFDLQVAFDVTMAIDQRFDVVPSQQYVFAETTDALTAYQCGAWSFGTPSSSDDSKAGCQRDSFEPEHASVELTYKGFLSTVVPGVLDVDVLARIVKPSDANATEVAMDEHFPVTCSR